MSKGGPNRGQGRKSKPPQEKFVKLRITLPPELAAKLEGANRSQLIQRLLTQYFERNEK